jgi:hypothetical protein
MERANTALVEQHKQKLDTIYPDSPEYSRERALFGVQSPLEWTDMGNGVKIRKK